MFRDLVSKNKKKKGEKKDILETWFHNKLLWILNKDLTPPYFILVLPWLFL